MKKLIKVLIFLLFIVLICAIQCRDKDMVQESSGLHALFFIPNHYGANYFLMRDAYEQMGWDVTHVSINDTCLPCPGFATVGNVPPIITDKLISQISDFQKYNALIITPSPGNFYKIPNPYQDIIESSEALQFIGSAYQNGLPVFAMCAGVKVLAAADIINGKSIVGSSRFKNDYSTVGATYKGNDKNDTPPLIDGKIITGARGQTYNYTNAEAVATVVEQESIRDKKKKLNANHIKERQGMLSSKGLQWSRTFGGPAADGGRAICKTKDEGFIITGYTFAPQNSDADILVIKTDKNGYMEWKRVIGGAGMDFGNDCCVTEDGYLITGYTTSFGNGKRDVFIVKIDSNGRTRWEKIFGGTENDVGMAISSTPEGYYYVSGFTSSFGKGEEDIYVVKIDAFGKEIWSETYGGKRMDRAKSVFTDADGGSVIGATSLSYGGENSDFYIFKIDESGDSLWANNFNAQGKWGHGFDRYQALCSTSDKGYLLTGYSDCNDMMDVVVVKTDDKGRELWTISFGRKPFYDYGNSIIEIQSGRYVVCGITKSIPAKDKLFDNDIFMAELDAQGNVIHNLRIQGGGDDWASDICYTNDESLVIVGHTTSTEDGSRDVCLLKIK